MADMSFKNIAIAFLLVSLFAISIYNFAIGVGGEYGYSADEFLSSDEIDFESLDTQIRETSEEAESWQEKFRDDNVFVAFGPLVMFSLWGIAKLMWNSINLIFELLFGGIAGVIGIDPMVVGVISAILLITIIFAIWRLLKVGE